MKESLSPNGRRDVENAMNVRLLPRVGDLLLEKINAAEVRDLVGSMKAKGYAPETINGTLAKLRKFLRDAVAREVIATDPIKGPLPLVKVQTLRLELSPEERAAFLSALDDEAGFRDLLAKELAVSRVERLEKTRERGLPTTGLRGGGLRPDGEAARYYFQRFRELRPIFVIALETGLRKGDLLALRWASVNAKGGWIRVSMGKTKEEALIPMSRACREAIEECRTRDVVSPEFVFVTDEGHRVPEVRVLRAFATAKRIARITRRFRFHDLRHTFASTLASEGVSLQVIAKALGHTTTKMSERYARPSEEAIRKAAEALDRANASSAMNSSVEPRIAAAPERPGDSAASGTPLGT
jgi:integrase